MEKSFQIIRLIRNIAVVSAMFLLVSHSMAETIVQVHPFIMKPHVEASENKFLDIQLSADDLQQSCQFDIKVPAGITVQDITLGDMSQSGYNLDFNTIDEEQNIIRVIVWSNEKGNYMYNQEGNILRIYYSYTNPAEDKNILHPIVFYNTIVGTPLLESASEKCTSSFFLVSEDSDIKSTNMETNDMEGYLPQFVCNSIMDYLYQDTLTVERKTEPLKTLMLPHVTSVAMPIVPVNKNAIVYCKAGSEAYKTISDARGSNVAEIKYNTEGEPEATAEKITLFAENLDYTRNYGFGFDLQLPVTAKEFELSRTFISNQYSSICLPFSMNEDRFSETFTENGIKVYEIKDFNLSKPEIIHNEVKEIKANTPYFAYFEQEEAKLPVIENLSLSPTNKISNKSCTSNGITLTFCGSYDASELSSANGTYYAYNASTGEFRKVGSKTYLYPFRAFIKVAANQQSIAMPARINAVFSSETTDIADEIIAEDNRNHAPGVYNLSGQRVGSNYHGITIENGHKIIR